MQENQWMIKLSISKNKSIHDRDNMDLVKLEPYQRHKTYQYDEYQVPEVGQAEVVIMTPY